MRARFDSFSGALSDARGAFDAFAFTGWSEEQKKIVVKLAFLATFAVMFYATTAVIFAHVWIGMAKAIGVRVLWGVGVSIGLAMAPPVFPNAAAHALALVLMAAEVALLSVNAILLGLVHLAIVLNKHVLPSWFHRAKVALRESAGGVDHRGRANAHFVEHRQETLSELERAKDYREWIAVANKLDAFPADVGEGGSRWKADEKSDVYDMAARQGIFEHDEDRARARRSHGARVVLANGATPELCRDR